MGTLSVFVRNCLIARNRPQSNLSKKDLLEGHSEYFTESSPCVPRPWGESFHSCHLSHGIPPLPVSQHGVHSSSLWTSRISSLTNSHGSNMASCLNPYFTEPYKANVCNSLIGTPIPVSWERESGGPNGHQL